MSYLQKEKEVHQTSAGKAQCSIAIHPAAYTRPQKQKCKRQIFTAKFSPEKLFFHCLQRQHMQCYKHGNGKQHHLQPQPRDNKHRDRYRTPQNRYGKHLAFLGYCTVCHIILNINAQFRMSKQPVAPTRISFQEQPGSEQKKRCCRQHGHKYADSPQYHAHKSGKYQQPVHSELQREPINRRKRLWNVKKPPPTNDRPTQPPTRTSVAAAPTNTTPHLSSRI